MKHQCVVASHTPPTGDLASSPGMCPDWELNLRPFGSQAGAQPTEPHQAGLYKWNPAVCALSGRASFTQHYYVSAADVLLKE